MDLLSIAILLRFKCVYFDSPVNRAQARAASMGFVLGGERKTCIDFCETSHNKRHLSNE